MLNSALAGFKFVMMVIPCYITMPQGRKGYSS